MIVTCDCGYSNLRSTAITSISGCNGCGTQFTKSMGSVSIMCDCGKHYKFRNSDYLAIMNCSPGGRSLLCSCRVTLLDFEGVSSVTLAAMKVGNGSWNTASPNPPPTPSYNMITNNPVPSVNDPFSSYIFPKAESVIEFYDPTLMLLRYNAELRILALNRNGKIEWGVHLTDKKTGEEIAAGYGDGLKVALENYEIASGKAYEKMKNETSKP